MCMFSGSVRTVAKTNLYARIEAGSGTAFATQYLVYSMTYASANPVAMILPLPVAPVRTALRFINLKGYPDFFSDLNKGFPVETWASRSFKGPSAGTPSTLAVESVGDFVASFVPTMADFARLDRRFTLPRRVWNQLPVYSTYGFAVFQLRETARNRKVHPMALEFSTTTPNTLFFPTVHVHDEQVHAREAFDHALYFQAKKVVQSPRPVATSPKRVRDFVKPDLAQDILQPDAHLRRLILNGYLPNRDTFVRVA